MFLGVDLPGGPGPRVGKSIRQCFPYSRPEDKKPSKGQVLVFFLPLSSPYPLFSPSPPYPILSPPSSSHLLYPFHFLLLCRFFSPFQFFFLYNARHELFFIFRMTSPGKGLRFYPLHIISPTVCVREDFSLCLLWPRLFYERLFFASVYIFVFALHIIIRRKEYFMSAGSFFFFTEEGLLMMAKKFIEK